MTTEPYITCRYSLTPKKLTRQHYYTFVLCLFSLCVLVICAATVFFYWQLPSQAIPIDVWAGMSGVAVASLIISLAAGFRGHSLKRRIIANVRLASEHLAVGAHGWEWNVTACEQFDDGIALDLERPGIKVKNVSLPAEAFVISMPPRRETQSTRSVVPTVRFSQVGYLLDETSPFETKLIFGGPVFSTAPLQELPARPHLRPLKSPVVRVT